MLKEAATAGDVCHRDVVVAPPTLSVDEAARLMRERHVGCLVVVEQGESGRLPAGVITDRDIVMAVVARDVDAKTVRVSDVMSPSVVSVAEKDTLFDVLSLIRRRGVRRLPVTGPHGVLAGVLSLDDVVGAIAGQLQVASSVTDRARKLEQASRP